MLAESELNLFLIDFIPSVTFHTTYLQFVAVSVSRPRYPLRL